MGVLFVLVLFIRFEPPTSAVRRQWRMQGSGDGAKQGERGKGFIPDRERLCFDSYGRCSNCKTADIVAVVATVTVLCYNLGNRYI